MSAKVCEKLLWFCNKHEPLYDFNDHQWSIHSARLIEKEDKKLWILEGMNCINTLQFVIKVEKKDIHMLLNEKPKNETKLHLRALSVISKYEAYEIRMYLDSSKCDPSKASVPIEVLGCERHFGLSEKLGMPTQTFMQIMGILVTPVV